MAMMTAVERTAAVRGRHAAWQDEPERSQLGALPCWTRYDTTVFKASRWLRDLIVDWAQIYADAICILHLDVFEKQ